MKRKNEEHDVQEHDDRRIFKSKKSLLSPFLSKKIDAKCSAKKQKTNVSRLAIVRKDFSFSNNA